MSAFEGHRARKRFGQNFLVDQGVINAIVHQIGPTAQQNIVEIGPGRGALTAGLAGKCQALHLIELDRDLIPGLEQQFASVPGCHLLNQDALQVDFCSLAPAGDKVRVVGNLPYNISTPLIFHLLEFRDCIIDMHFMLQKEVVERLAAKPGDAERGRLGVMIQYFCEVEQVLEVPPGAFRPIPKVDSAVVRLTLRAPPNPVRSIPSLQLVVRDAFAHRRKTLRNNLKKLFTDEQLEACGINPSWRAEVLTLDQFVELANLLQP